MWWEHIKCIQNFGVNIFEVATWNTEDMVEQSVIVGFMVDKVALGQVFLRVLRFSPVNFIPPVLHYLEKWKTKLIIFLFIFITGLHNKP
jgi:hypothetical protein